MFYPGKLPRLSPGWFLAISFLILTSNPVDGTTCPAGFPSSSDCNICQNDDDCGAQSICTETTSIAPLSQSIAMSCNITAPQKALMVPGWYMSCSVLKQTCTAELKMYEDMVVCRMSNCALETNQYGGYCTDSVCGCSPGPCKNPVVQSTFQDPPMWVDWGCEQGSTCGLFIDTLPLRSLEASCSIRQCVSNFSTEESDANEFLMFKDSFINGPEALPEWSASNGDFCNWPGVRCDGDVATQVILMEDGLEGTIPPGMWQLPDSVQLLDLAANRINGTLPTDMGSTSSLKVIFLSANQLTGTIPPNWQLPPQLHTIWVDSNLLTGSIPSTLKLPGDLKVFFIDLNQLTGSIDPGWELPPGLWELSLTDNFLTGTIPGNWALPLTLRYLSLSNNMLNGSIPDAWQLPSSLRVLDLGNNALTGTIPQDWVPPSGLRVINLANNKLEGPIPPLDGLPNAEIILLPGNQGLCGKLPPGLKAVDALGESLAVDQLPPCPEAGDEGSSTGGSSTGAIVGGVVGGVAGIVMLVVALAVLAVRVRRKRQRPHGSSALAVGRHDSTKALVVGGMGPASGDSLESSEAAAKHHLPSPWQALDVQDWLGNGGLQLQGDPGIKIPFSGQKGSDSSSALGTPVGTEPLGVGTKAFGGHGSSDDTTQESFPSKPSSESPQMAGQELSLAVRGSNDLDATVSNTGRGQAIMKTWTFAFKDLRLEQKIGEGSYGRVYLAMWQETPVAVKVLMNTGVDAFNEEAVQPAITLSNPLLANLQKEAGLLATLRHPNVVGFLGVCAVPPCVVTEYCANGSITEVLRSAIQSPEFAEKLHWLQRLNMLLDTARGMLYLHSLKAPIIHRDLKSPNLLVDEHWRVKVSDFNLSRILGDAAALSSAQATNPRWQAPEVLQGESATLLSDVYSYGVVMWEMLTWEMPFAIDNQWQIVQFVSEGGRLSVPPLDQLPGRDTPHFSGLGDYIQLMRSCWAQVPQDRPTFTQIIDAMRSLLAEKSTPSSKSGSNR